MVAAQHSPSKIRQSVNQLAPGTKRFQQLQRLQVQRTADLAPLCPQQQTFWLWRYFTQLFKLFRLGVSKGLKQNLKTKLPLQISTGLQVSDFFLKMACHHPIMSHCFTKYVLHSGILTSSNIKETLTACLIISHRIFTPKLVGLFSLFWSCLCAGKQISKEIEMS